MPFDPLHGADQARAYATKYASKPEKWYYLETESNSLKDWLKARTNQNRMERLKKINDENEGKEKPESSDFN